MIKYKIAKEMVAVKTSKFFIILNIVTLLCCAESFTGIFFGTFAWLYYTVGGKTMSASFITTFSQIEIILSFVLMGTAIIYDIVYIVKERKNIV